MNLFKSIFSAIASVYVVSPIPAAASAIRQELNCQPIPLTSDLSSLPDLSELIFCGPAEAIDQLGSKPTAD